VLDNEIFPPGYSLYRADRGSRGGGVLLAVSDCIPSSLIATPPGLESVAVLIHLASPVVVCLVYLPPSTTPLMFSSLLTFLSTISADYETIVLGDFNMPDIDWGTLSGSSPLSSSLMEFMFDENLTQHVSAPTHTLKATS
jgi:hypothetical protein